MTKIPETSQTVDLDAHLREWRLLGLVVRGLADDAPTDDGSEAWRISEVMFIDHFISLRQRAQAISIEHTVTVSGPNEKQQAVIDRITQAFGGEHEVKKLDHRVWFRASKGGDWKTGGQLLYGLIGMNGELDLILRKQYGTEQIMNSKDIKTYLVIKC